MGNPTRAIISFYGGSGSGKSTLAKGLAERLGLDHAVRIPTDYFLKSYLYDIPAGFEQHPLEYDWKLLEALMENEDGVRLTTPDFDFTTLQRRRAEGGRPFTLRPILILDSMVPYPRAGIKVLIRAPEEERARRIITRDACWGTQVIRFWQLHQTTLAWALRGCLNADLVLDGTAAASENMQAILTSEAFHRALSQL